METLDEPDHYLSRLWVDGGDMGFMQVSCTCGLWSSSGPLGVLFEEYREHVNNAEDVKATAGRLVADLDRELNRVDRVNRASWMREFGKHLPPPYNSPYTGI